MSSPDYTFVLCLIAAGVLVMAIELCELADAVEKIAKGKK